MARSTLSQRPQPVKDTDRDAPTEGAQDGLTIGKTVVCGKDGEPVAAPEPAPAE